MPLKSCIAESEEKQMEQLPIFYLPKGGQISLHKEERSPGYTAGRLHCHDHEEMLLVNSSCNFLLESNGKSFEIQGPAVIFHRAGAFHEIISVLDGDVCSCKVVFFRLDPAIRKLPLFKEQWDLMFSECRLEEIKSLLDYYQLMQSSDTEERAARLRASLLRAGRLSALKGFQTHYAGERYLFELIHYLSEHYAEKNNLEDIARTFHVSPGKLKIDFRRVAGMTVKQFLSELRLKRAMEYLEEGRKLSAVATDTGFSSESHFISVFHQHFGITPAAYQKSLR